MESPHLTKIYRERMGSWCTHAALCYAPLGVTMAGPIPSSLYSFPRRYAALHNSPFPMLQPCINYSFLAPRSTFPMLQPCTTHSSISVIHPQVACACLCAALLSLDAADTLPIVLSVSRCPDQRALGSLTQVWLLSSTLGTVYVLNPPKSTLILIFLKKENCAH